jgi:integrase/recombinase XerD
LVENGAPIRLIQALLGHTTLKVTTKYLRLSDEKIKKEHKETHPSNRRDLYYGRVEEQVSRASN